MSRRTSMVLAAASLTWAGVSGISGVSEAQIKPWQFDQPQAKINYVDVSKAPQIKLWVSYLDRRLRPIDHEAFVTETSIQKDPPKGKAEEIFAFVGDEIRWPDSVPEEEIADKFEPTFTLAGEEENGMAVMVIMPGTSPDAYKASPLGAAMKTAADLIFKAGANADMNVLWVTDQVYTYVQGDNRVGLSKLKTAQEGCDKWNDRVLRGDVPQAEDGEEPPKDKDELHCGLTREHGDIPKMLEETPYSGFWPHMWGLKGKICAKKPRYMRKSDDFEVAPDAYPSEPPAFEVALKTLIRDAKPGQPKAIVILGDARDGYLLNMDECKAQFTKQCEQANPQPERERGMRRKEYWGLLKQWKETKRKCLDEALKKIARAEQETFAKKLPTWLALARSANIRVYTLANSFAEPHERERLEVLSLRTGGTYRVAADSNELVEEASRLADELAQQYVITFVDDDAVPGAQLDYAVELKYETRNTSGKTETPVYEAHVPKKPEGFSVWLMNVRTFGEEKLGKAGFLAAVIAIGLILGLILLKILKKIFGKGAKKAKGAGKGAKGLKKGAKGAKGAMKTIRKINK